MEGMLSFEPLVLNTCMSPIYYFFCHFFFNALHFYDILFYGSTKFGSYCKWMNIMFHIWIVSMIAP